MRVPSREPSDLAALYVPLCRPQRGNHWRQPFNGFVLIPGCHDLDTSESHLGKSTECVDNLFNRAMDRAVISQDPCRVLARRRDNEADRLFD